MRDRHGHRVLIEMPKLIGQQRCLPQFSWLELLPHLVILEFMLRVFAPDLAEARVDAVAEKERVLG